MVFSESSTMFYVHQFFESKICNCERVGLSGPQDLIKDQNVLPSPFTTLGSAAFTF